MLGFSRSGSLKTYCALGCGLVLRSAETVGAVMAKNVNTNKLETTKRTLVCISWHGASQRSSLQ